MKGRLLMNTPPIHQIAPSKDGFSEDAIQEMLEKSLSQLPTQPKRVLLIPPDITRIHSGTGALTCLYYRLLSPHATIKILPALGTHQPMTAAERDAMFPDIPHGVFVDHDWRHDVAPVGTIPGTWLKEHTQGWTEQDLKVDLNTLLLDDFDLIISLGQVVPHEVAGMANYTKNIVVGCGGKPMIDLSHMLGAIHGIEHTLGQQDNPVRALFDYAQEQFLSSLPLLYVLTVTDQDGPRTRIQGMFIGCERETFEAAVALSEQINIFTLDRPLQKAVVWLDPKKFKTTWVGNKAIYRTRLALADDAELVIIAPGIQKFGEDPGNDALIRKYGYRPTPQVLKWLEEEDDLRENLSVAAHLIHGTSEGRFRTTYAVEHMSQEEIEAVGFQYASLHDMYEQYPIDTWTDGFQRAPSGEEVYYISNPAVALWKV
tara:strand:- start:2285 stop:3568 length:1284 start_codon:yes stop_codon:yes gene_type:complete